jgi:hypothetical protein
LEHEPAFGLFEELFALIKKEVYKCKDYKKIFAAIKVYVQLALYVTVDFAVWRRRAMKC